MNDADPKSVIFVCTGNTCRSVIAEYLTKRRYPMARIESAGLRLIPGETPATAVDALMARFEIDASRHRPRSLEGIDPSVFAKVVAIDDRGRRDVYSKLRDKGLPPDSLLNWKIKDPYGDDLAAYDQCLLEIQKAVLKFQMC